MNRVGGGEGGEGKKNVPCRSETFPTQKQKKKSTTVCEDGQKGYTTRGGTTEKKGYFRPRQTSHGASKKGEGSGTGMGKLPSKRAKGGPKREGGKQTEKKTLRG